MKQIGELFLPTGWDATPLQGYPQQYITGTHLYTWVKRDKVEYQKLQSYMKALNQRPLESGDQRANHYTSHNLQL